MAESDGRHGTDSKPLNDTTMSVKKQMRRAAKAAREAKQQKRAMGALMGALAVLIILGIIAFAIMGNEF